MKDAVEIIRTEQWEWTAYGYGEEAAGSSETNARLALLEKVINKKCIVVWKDGTWKVTDVSWEYENEHNWLVTIPIGINNGDLA